MDPYKSNRAGVDRSAIAAIINAERNAGEASWVEKIDWNSEEEVRALLEYLTARAIEQVEITKAILKWPTLDWHERFALGAAYNMVVANEQ